MHYEHTIKVAEKANTYRMSMPMGGAKHGGSLAITPTNTAVRVKVYVSEEPIATGAVKTSGTPPPGYTFAGTLDASRARLDLAPEHHLGHYAIVRVAGSGAAWVTFSGDAVNEPEEHAPAEPTPRVVPPVLATEVNP